MSEPMFPAPAAASAPTSAEPAAAAAGNSKALLAVGGVVGALVIGAGAFFLLSGSGGEEEVAMPAARPAVTAPAAAPQATQKPATTTVRAAVVTSRDPFLVLYPEPAPKPVVDNTSTNSIPSQSVASAPPVAAPVAPVTKATIVVTAVDVPTSTAKISVNGKAYVVKAGGQFAKYYQMYSVFNSTCVGILFGDQNVPACIGSPVQVTTS